MDIEPDPTSCFANHSTTFQSVVDSIYGVVLHADQEARAKLWVGSTSIEQSRRSVREVSLRHEVVCLDDAVDISSVYADSHTHDHMLWALCDASIDAKEVRAFKGFETKAIGRSASNA